MSNTHFLVSQKDTVWQFSHWGEVTGPFTTRREAIEAAIAQAVATNDGDVEVIVQDADMKAETVWRPSAQG